MPRCSTALPRGKRLTLAFFRSFFFVSSWLPLELVARLQRISRIWSRSWRSNIYGVGSLLNCSECHLTDAMLWPSSGWQAKRLCGCHPFHRAPPPFFGGAAFNSTHKCTSMAPQRLQQSCFCHECDSGCKFELSCSLENFSRWPWVGA